MATCKEPDCPKDAQARGMCNAHWKRWRRLQGDSSLRPPTFGMTTIERFAYYVDSSNGPDACHLWTAGKSEMGYGYFTVNGRSHKAHNWILGHLRGRPLSGDEFACHYCDNPSCVNPKHLYVGSALTNNRDTVIRRRHREVLKTRCIHGHELTPENTYLTRKGHRECRECKRRRNRAAWPKRAKRENERKRLKRAEARRADPATVAAARRTIRQETSHG